MEQSATWEANRPVKKFPTFYGNQSFITTFTSAPHLSLPWARSIQSMPPHPTSWRSILTLSSYLYVWVFQVFHFPQFSPPKPFIHLCSPPIRATCPSHPILLDLGCRPIRMIIQKSSRFRNQSMDTAKESCAKCQMIYKLRNLHPCLQTCTHWYCQKHVFFTSVFGFISPAQPCHWYIWLSDPISEVVGLLQ
jgi:hypothetical protein